jgi:hypothetical protein
MEDEENFDARFERFWKNIEPSISKIAGTAELRALRYAVKLGFEAGHQTLLRDLHRFLQDAAEAEYVRGRVELEPA